MIIRLILILCFLPLCLCSAKKPLTDQILDYQCSLEMDNLVGNVKEMVHYNQKMINDK